MLFFLLATRLSLPLYRTLKNRHHCASDNDVYPGLPNPSLLSRLLYGKNIGIASIVEDIHVCYAIPVVLTKVGDLSASFVTGLSEVRKSGIVEGKLQEGEDGRGAEGARRLLTAVDAVAVVELDQCGSWDRELIAPHWQ
jgi:hypothetical protein